MNQKQMEMKTLCDLSSDCLAEILKYLCFEDIIAVKETATSFHDGVSISLREGKEISLDSFGSVGMARAFFRDIPFQIKKLDIASVGEAYRAFRTEYLSIVLNAIQLENVTHLITDSLGDHRFLRGIVDKFRNIRSIALCGMEVEEINIWLGSMEAETVEEISILDFVHKFRFRSGAVIDNSCCYDIFLGMLRKHGSRLRSFELDLRKLPSSHVCLLAQSVINILADFAPNLETLKLPSDYSFPLA